MVWDRCAQCAGKVTSCIVVDDGGYSSRLASEFGFGAERASASRDEGNIVQQLIWVICFLAAKGDLTRRFSWGRCHGGGILSASAAFSTGSEAA